MRGTLGRIVELCGDFLPLRPAMPDRHPASTWPDRTGPIIPPVEDELENVLVRALKSEAKLTLHQSNGAASDTQSVCR